MHGGAAGSGAQAGNKNALKHGLYTAELAELRQYVRELQVEAREIMELVPPLRIESSHTSGSC